MKTRGTIYWVLLALFVALSGCNRAVVSTEIQADGGWKRTVKLYGGSEKKDAAMPMSMSIDDVFQVPKGAGWQVKRGVETPKSAKPNDNPFAVAMSSSTIVVRLFLFMKNSPSTIKERLPLLRHGRIFRACCPWIRPITGPRLVM